MILPPEEKTLFFKLYPALIGFAAGRLGGVAGITDIQSFRQASQAARMEARDALLDHISLIRDFVEENPGDFHEQELGLAVQWEHFVRGSFIIERNLKEFTIFLDDKEPAKVYGVLSLSEEIIDMLPPLPAFVQAVLLPWKGKIVCDGLIGTYNLIIGGGMKRNFAEAYRQAKAQGIITSLDPGWKPLPPAPPQKPKTPAIQRFLKKCPRTVEEFQKAFGEPRMDMGLNAAQEFSPWSLDGKPALDIDYLMIYPNILRHQVLYVYAKNKQITHIAVVDPTEFHRQDFKPHPGWRLMH
jgi:hypothetical protein